MAKKENDAAAQTFHALVERADRKFGRVRDLPLYGRAPQNHYFQKVFKAYMRLWKYQQENRSKLVDSGLKRWEIGEIASRIGQLYFNQYMRTSEARFLVEAYVFYEAILERKYFDARGSGKPKVDVGVRFKELRFYARFLLVALIFNKVDMVRLLAERIKGLVDDSKTNFRETNFKEWKLVVQEIFRFMEVDTAFTNVRPLRYCALFDSHPASRPYLARFHAKKIVKFSDALLTSYHRKRGKCFLMFVMLFIDKNGNLVDLSSKSIPVESVYQKHPVESNENGTVIDHSGAASGLIDINLAADLTDPTLPPNPRKAVLYRPVSDPFPSGYGNDLRRAPSREHCAGKAACSNLSQAESSGESRKSSKDKVVSGEYGTEKSSAHESHCNGKRESSDYYDNYLWLGPRGYGGSNALYPGDIIPFTRRPLFLIIDSDSSHAFKVLHGAERREPAALFLSPLKPAFKNLSAVDTTHSGSQFTFFLTAPLQAFCQMVGLTSADSDMDFYNDAEEILSIAFSERLILRFIFCRSVLSAFCPLEDEQYMPCLPAPSSQFCLCEMRSCAVSCNPACKSPEGGRLFSV
ncbi:hypothetical protein OIU76_024995 [Salix suchowensis]|nr:hypothetical protein OIU76_024995 [Salix suchowensis]